MGEVQSRAETDLQDLAAHVGEHLAAESCHLGGPHHPVAEAGKDDARIDAHQTSLVTPQRPFLTARKGRVVTPMEEDPTLDLVPVEDRPAPPKLYDSH
jgi:hypothetical protein